MKVWYLPFIHSWDSGSWKLSYSCDFKILVLLRFIYTCYITFLHFRFYIMLLIPYYLLLLLLLLSSLLYYQYFSHFFHWFYIIILIYFEATFLESFFSTFIWLWSFVFVMFVLVFCSVTFRGFFCFAKLECDGMLTLR